MSPRKPQYEVHIVPHTHWDREWYRTFQQFRYRLVKLVDGLLDIMENDPEYTCFVLDGQTIILEDYLEIKPQNRRRLKQLVKAGRIAIGPFYILPDEFLVSGEATVRNLILGHRLAKEFGGVMKVGYLPDSFGHISQLPQILRGFGIDNFIFSRGVDDRIQETGPEFSWEGADGTTVLGLFEVGGYGNLYMLTGNRVEDLGILRTRLKVQREHSNGTILLLHHGGDHKSPKAWLPEFLAYANSRIKGTRFVQSNFGRYVEAVKKQNLPLKRYAGELRAGYREYLLPGVLSTRMYIKQANQRGQCLLENWVEPFCSFAHFLGAPYPHEFIWHAWKTLMKNHPHDSICGCSIDQVHREMIPRFDESRQLGEELLTDAFKEFAGRIDTRVRPAVGIPLLVFNPLPGNQTKPVIANVTVSATNKGWQLGDPIVIVDHRGRPLPTQELSRERGILEPRPFKQRKTPTSEVEIAFLPRSFPGVGYATFAAVPKRLVKNPPSLDGGWTVEPRRASNGLLEVCFNGNGSFDLTDLETGHVSHACHLFEDVGDAGDEYNFHTPAREKPLTTVRSRARIELIESGPVCVKYRVSLAMRLPASLTPTRKGRSRNAVRCDINSMITLWHGVKRVDIETTVENRARDHRLRVLFPTGVHAKLSFAQGQFDCVARPITLRPLKECKDWREDPYGTYPVEDFVDVYDAGCGVAVAPQGLTEYEVIHLGRSRDAVIALTLLRCVGKIVDDNVTARHPGFPEFREAVVDSQCLGTNTFRYAVLPHVGDWAAAQVPALARRFRIPPRVVHTQRHAGDLPKELSLLQIEPADLLLSTVKRAEGRDTLVVRIANITSQPVIGAIRFHEPIRRANLLNLAEEIQKRLAVGKDGTVAISLRPKKIVTIELVPLHPRT